MGSMAPTDCATPAIAVGSNLLAWAGAYCTANFSLGGPDIRSRSEDARLGHTSLRTARVGDSSILIVGGDAAPTGARGQSSPIYAAAPLIASSSESHW